MAESPPAVSRSRLSPEFVELARAALPEVAFHRSSSEFRAETPVLERPFSRAVARAPRAVVDSLESLQDTFVNKDLWGSVTLDADSVAFVLYEPEDYTGLHTDKQSCSLTLVALLSGQSHTVEFAGRAWSLMDRSWAKSPTFLEAARRETLSAPGEAVVFGGTAIPHQRRPSALATVILTACFGRDLSPASAWRQ